MAFRNKIAVRCKTCNTPVEVGKGWSYGPPWVTKCQPCSGEIEAALKIEIRRQKNDAVIKPIGYLGDKFSTYLKCVEGARFEPISRCQIAPIVKLAPMIEKLHNASFTLDIEPALSAHLQSLTAQQKITIQNAGERADKIDAILKERGQALFPFQKAGTGWLASKYGALLADEMGLGKTIQGLAALPDNAPVLVICPALAKGVWMREAAKWRPEYKVAVLSGRGNFRWPEQGEIVIINFDILPEFASKKTPDAEPVIAPEGVVLLADEVHAVKSSKAARTVKFRALSEGVRANGGRVWGLTGTPLLNKQTELWSVLQALGCAQDAFGSWKRFVEVMGGREDTYGYVWPQSPPDPEAVGERLKRVMLRRLRTEVLPELPVKIWKQIPVDLDAKTTKQLDKYEEEIKARVRATRDGVPRFEEMSEARKALARVKIPAMLGVVEQFEESEEPLVVFSAHVAPIEELAKREGWAVITGDTSSEDRTRIEDAFQAGKLKGVGATIKAGGVAITLTPSSSTGTGPLHSTRRPKTASAASVRTEAASSCPSSPNTHSTSAFMSC